MDVVIDFVKQSKANARTTLLKARSNPSVQAITIIHESHERLPDMAPFGQVSQDAQGKTTLTTYRRKA